MAAFATQSILTSFYIHIIYNIVMLNRKMGLKLGLAGFLTLVLSSCEALTPSSETESLMSEPEVTSQGTPPPTAAPETPRPVVLAPIESVTYVLPSSLRVGTVGAVSPVLVGGTPTNYTISPD